MAILDQITSDMKEAMKRQDAVARDTLRMIKTDASRRELELGRPLEDGEVMEVLLRAVKTRRESLEQYTEGGRADLAAKEQSEIAIIEAYLPKAMDENAAREAVRAIAAELGVTSKKDMGKVMKEVTARFKGQIEGKLASKLAGEILS
jgi:uncharacterized protein YqeY